MIILMMIIIILIIVVIMIAIMILIIKIIPIIALVIIVNSPFQPDNFSTGSTTVIIRVQELSIDFWLIKGFDRHDSINNNTNNDNNNKNNNNNDTINVDLKLLVNQLQQ